MANVARKSIQAALFANNGWPMSPGGITPPTRGSWGFGRNSLNGSNASPADRPGGGSLELEAVAAVHELSFAVSGITVSEMLPRTPEIIFVNVTTLEGQAYCLELTGKGWRVTSLRHDCMNGDINNIDLHTRYFESPYALMDTVSPGYRAKFSEALSYKLSQLSSSLPPHQLSQMSGPVPAQQQSAGELSPRPPSEMGLGPIPQQSSVPTGLLSVDTTPVKVAVRHPSGDANQQFPDQPSPSRR